MIMTYVITIAAGALPAGAAGISLTASGGRCGHQPHGMRREYPGCCPAAAGGCWAAAEDSEQWPF
jgi:hypothetical protein